MKPGRGCGFCRDRIENDTARFNLRLIRSFDGKALVTDNREVRRAQRWATDSRRCRLILDLWPRQFVLLRWRFALLLVMPFKPQQRSSPCAFHNPKGVEHPEQIGPADSGLALGGRRHPVAGFHASGCLR